MLTKLSVFRQSAYNFLGFAKDSTFDLMDAILTTKSLKSFPELSFSPLFRRSWSSIYESIKDCRPQAKKLMKLYIQQMPTETRPLLAGDHTAWARPFAKTLKDRTYEHCVNGTGSKPVTIGQGYSTLAWIPEDKGSWALPLRHELITSFESPLKKAAFQIQQVCKEIKVRPITVWDSEYGNATFIKLTANFDADKLMRLRPNLCLWTSPPPYSGLGRPKVHGDKFKLSQESTWTEPIKDLQIEDPDHGKVRLRYWSDLHFRKSPDHPMDVVAVNKINPKTGQFGSTMWLSWVGLESLPPEKLWRLYLRRFTVDHWNRFVKQRLHWTLPRFSTPKQCQRWSHLMPLMTWQLWLARNTVPDNPLPWQKRQLRGEMTPGRVAQGFASLLAVIGTPAIEPKPRGKSSGWQKGQKRSKKTRFPVAKKSFSRRKNKKKSTK